MKYFLLILLSVSAHANEGLFSGRVSKNNPDAKLIRVFVEFDNLKYINRKDKLAFWKNGSPSTKCKGYILGKSTQYLLVKIPKYESCARKIPMGRGFYLKFFSQDLVKNIKTGRELMKILLKKRLGIKGQLEKAEKNLKSYVEKIEGVNGRYEILRQKLELEWGNQLSYLDEDKTNTLRYFKELEVRLDEVDHKLEIYRIADENLKADRWSLDPKFYFKK
ncbi:MAG: hypothetical protein DRQ88_07535 [Epsilonproteobacteria bacterium]|nr:MAG: hypothetical protein DRQ89_03410 [Campylobacterota bacterium]RLA66175.1 MAG: hypothetical protein DRQ88_07535 [Campylobacterota bacterium]